MKANQVRPEAVKLPKEPCTICQKPVTSFYGRWGNSGTCSRKCEQVKEAQERNKFLGYV